MFDCSPIRTVIRHKLANNQTIGIKRLTSKKCLYSHIRHFPNRYLFLKQSFLATYLFFGECANNDVFRSNHSVNKANHCSPTSGEQWCEYANSQQEVHHGD